MHAHLPVFGQGSYNKCEHFINHHTVPINEIRVKLTNQSEIDYYDIKCIMQPDYFTVYCLPQKYFTTPD